MSIPDIGSESVLFEDAAAWLPEPIRQALSVAPPRPMPPGTVGRLARGRMTLTFWAGVALTNVGGFYTVIFLAMGAPWQIPAAAGAVASIGLLLLAACAASVAVRAHLFRRGVVTAGVLERMARPGPKAPRPLFGTSTEVAYRFTDSWGSEHRVSSTILWNDRFSELEEGGLLGVLYRPERPDRNLPLIALI